MSMKSITVFKFPVINIWEHSYSISKNIHFWRFGICKRHKSLSPEFRVVRMRNVRKTNFVKKNTKYPFINEII